MNTRTITAIVLFAAVSIVLNLSPIKFPAPYAPFLIYQIWEIPIVTALLLYGVRVGVLVTVVNTIALFAFFPGALPTGPMYNLGAVLSMILGIIVAEAVMRRYKTQNKGIAMTVYTTSGTVLRTICMVIVNYVLLRFPPPIGYGLPEIAILASIPLVAVFNISIALYTIPIGYSLAEIVKSRIKTYR